MLARYAFREPRAVAHTIRDKTKLLHRIRRIKGQLEAAERAVEEEQDCSVVLHTLAACRGALNGLVAEVIEGHIRHHVVNPDTEPTSEQARAAQQLIDVVRAYLK
jgi:DNA-binding FrmR family transcriptional regulator